MTSEFLKNQKPNWLWQQQVDDLMHRICAGLQISDTKRKLAEERYMAVSKWIGAEDGPFADRKVDIYPQGSLRIQTTVKPFGQQEFDLDLVLQIDMGPDEMTPEELLEKVEERLRENKTYAAMCAEKKSPRCARLCYADDFHMDILPALPVAPKDASRWREPVVVPDRRLHEWSPSNPKGFAEYFEDKASTKNIMNFADYAKGYNRFTFEAFKAEADVQPMPDPESIYSKPPLKRAVQLIKRARDVYFVGREDEAPISIVLTTLAANHYQHKPSVFQTILDVLEGIQRQAEHDEQTHWKKRLVVLNPTNTEEDFSEKWDAKRKNYHAFKEFVVALKATMEELGQAAEASDTELISKVLSRLFDPERVQTAMKDQLRDIANARDAQGIITVVTGAGAARPEFQTPTRRPNTFHLSDENG